MKKKQNQDNSWIGPVVIYVLCAVLLVALLMMSLVSCSPKYITETKIEYRDRVVHDTATVEVPVEAEKIVTRDTVSHLENNWAKSDAMVSDGFLHHSLESKPQIIKVPVEVHVTDTIKVEKEAQIIEKEVKVTEPLSWWQKFRQGAFWWLLGAVALLLVWTFRKWIFKL